MKHVIVYAQCCRIWPIVAFQPLGKCGLCGERPTILPQEDQARLAQEVSGSNPLASTVAEAEVADAPGCGPGGSGFESRQSPQTKGTDT